MRVLILFMLMLCVSCAQPSGIDDGGSRPITEDAIISYIDQRLDRKSVV